MKPRYRYDYLGLNGAVRIVDTWMGGSRLVIPADDFGNTVDIHMDHLRAWAITLYS